MLYIELIIGYVIIKLSKLKFMILRFNIVLLIIGYMIDLEKMILFMMFNEVFIIMVICGGLVVLVVVFIIIIGMYLFFKFK